MFDNREQAGEALASAVEKLEIEDCVVYGLPRGGLPVAAAIAKRLGAPLDLILVRKLGAPWQEELAIGAVADGETPSTILNEDLIRELNVSEDHIRKSVNEALAEIERRRAIFFKNHKPVPAKDRTVIIVDDGLATGATMEAAVKAMRTAGAKRVIVAVPVAPGETTEKFRRLADDFVCLETPAPFWAVGNHYREFPQLADADVVRILEAFEKGAPAKPEEKAEKAEKQPEERKDQEATPNGAR